LSGVLRGSAPECVRDLMSHDVMENYWEQQVLDALFPLPGYLRGLKGF
jgi:hypothetical protein